MKRTYFTFGVIFLWLLSLDGNAQRVEMLCTQIDTSGKITVSWEGTAIPMDYEYQLYACKKNINGTYFSLDSHILPPISFYEHSDAKGGADQWFYFVKAVPIPPATGATYTSDTLGSIYLYPLASNKGVVPLRWFRPSEPPLPSQDANFVILQGEEEILHPYTTCDTTYYVDTVHVCQKILYYQISLHDNRGCDNLSIVRSDLITDGIAPETPQLDSVSINLVTDKTELGWNPSSSSDTYGYIIYIKKDGIWITLDTVFGAENTHYIDLKNDATGNIQKYCIAAIDTCLNASPIGDSLNTMILSASCDKCNNIINLSWNACENMPDGLTGYRIFTSENGGSFYLVDTVLPNKLSYTHKGVNTFNSYTYYIQAYNITNGYTSSSTKVDVICNRQAHSGDVWLRYASVVNNKDIEVAVFVKDTVEYYGLLLYRCDNKEGHFSKIDEKTRASGVENYLFTDTKADVQTTTYLYTVALTDECDHPFVQSDTANNIILRAVEASADINEMEWTVYEGFRSRLDGYDVYRQLQTEPDFQLITNLPVSQTDYTENVYGMAAQGGKFYYQVAATEDHTNPYGFRDQSFSNSIEITKSPQSFIPNAFSPSSEIEVNRVFKPVLTYVDAKEYVFAIYDRWGNQIFYTNDITLGWDGNIGGKPAAMGIYQYTLVYRLNETKMYKTQGHVTLIR